MIVSVGIVGMGYFGPNYVRVLSGLPNVSLKYICDSNPLRLRRDLQVTNVEDVGVLARDPSLDAVCIVTPPATHYWMAKMMLEAGKHVLVEKPMTLSVGEAGDLVATARKAGRTLMVGHIYVHHAAVRKIKEFVDDDRLGELSFGISNRIGPGPVRNDVHCYWDLLPHELSILDYLGYRPELVSAMGSYLREGSGIFDHATVNLKFPKRFVFTAVCNWCNPDKTRLIFLYGDEDCVKFDDNDKVYPLKLGEMPVYLGSSGTDKPASNNPQIAPTEPLRLELDNFIHCVGTGDKPHSDGEQGLRVVRALDAIDFSAHRNGMDTRVGP